MSATPGSTITRARHGAVRVAGAAAPHDTVHYRIFHPAGFGGTEAERQSGSLPPDTTAAPWPVVIVIGGINVNPDGYRWLAEHLAPLGIATVLYQFVGEISPGQIGLSPGLDLTALTPDSWGTRPSATAIGPLIDALREEHHAGPLEGLLDLDRIALLGHSAGGTVAMLNADPKWFGIRGVISYAGHTMPASMLGHPEATVLPLAPEVPALVLAGGEDAVIAASASRYAAAAAATTTAAASKSSGNDTARPSDHDPVSATFATATAPGSALVVLRTATHLTLCDPVDSTTARGFLELADPHGPAHRAHLAALIDSFLNSVFAMGRTTPDLAELGADPVVSVFRQC
jgi:dienelactone hydrolase